jgi:ABC-2 type transport system ATP-binding protein
MTSAPIAPPELALLSPAQRVLHNGAGQILAIDAVGVRKIFHGKKPSDARCALDDVSIAVAAGSIMALVGPDGAGKTTLLRALAGLIAIDGGRIAIMGADVAHMNRASVGYLPQNGGIYGDLSVRENLRLFARLRGVQRVDEAAAITRVLDATDLAPFATRMAAKLSGGMAMKLAVGCAMIAKPDIVLLDEPSVGVDPISRADMWALVRRLSGDAAQTGVIWATANLDEAERADAITLLHEGQVRYTGPPADFAARSEGRVFSVVIGGAQGRRVLSAALQTPDIVDGSVQGSSLRLLMARSASPPEAGALAHLNLQPSVPQPARLEDSYIDTLGGTRIGPSMLAADYARPSADAPSLMIEAQQLTKTYGRFTAADTISFGVKRGEIFGLLGPNGAGKSTTFKMLCGLISASNGQGLVAGYDLRSARSSARQSLGYMAQRFSLYADLSVRQNLAFFAGSYGLGGGKARDAIARMAHIFALEPFLSQDAGALPLGLKQRLSLACAVMHQPPVLFLDEPTSGVDPLVRREFWSHINGLAERGVTIFVTTHFMDEAEYCDRIALIFRGKAIALDTPEALKSTARAILAQQATGRSQTATIDPSLEQAFVALVEHNRQLGAVA